MRMIRTKYLGPTNFKGSRIIVTDGTNRCIVQWDYAHGQFENHYRAFKQFVRDHRAWEIGEEFNAISETRGYAFTPKQAMSVYA